MSFGHKFSAGFVGPVPRGRLSGTTKVAGSPDMPVGRVVHIATGAQVRGMLPGDMLPVAWKASDPVTGEWEITGLDETKKYHAIAYDHTGQYDPVIKMNLVPTVD